MMKKRNSARTHPEVKSTEGKRIVKQLTKAGFPNHRIASLFDVNQGRIAEVNGKKK
jgi:predicted XRE-type DNA-binding protein